MGASQNNFHLYFLFGSAFSEGVDAGWGKRDQLTGAAEIRPAGVTSIHPSSFPPGSVFIWKLAELKLGNSSVFWSFHQLAGVKFLPKAKDFEKLASLPSIHSSSFPPCSVLLWKLAKTVLTLLILSSARWWKISTISQSLWVGGVTSLPSSHSLSLPPYFIPLTLYFPINLSGWYQGSITPGCLSSLTQFSVLPR